MNDGNAEHPPSRPQWQWPVIHVHVAAVFLTRVPLPPLPSDCPPLARAVWALPLIGAVIGALSGGVLVGLDGLGVSSPITALLAVLVGVLLTGALHEDGLADVADGFGGGRDRAHKLEIMRDSRIGTYGIVALIITFALRVAAVETLPTATQAAWVLSVAHAVGRAMIPLLMRISTPARQDGLAASAGRPAMSGVILALLVAGGLSLAVSPELAPALCLGGLVATGAVAFVTHRHIGGYTGDVLGSVAVIGEVVVLIIAGLETV